jgi:hypothetical protein
MVKLTHGVNFINVRILRQYFGAKNYKAMIWVSTFWRQNIGKKSAHKMLVKLTHGAILYRKIFSIED